MADVLTRWIAPGVPIESETAVPARHFRVDFLLRVGDPAPTWGLLQPAVGHREVIIEAWADAIPRRGLLTSYIKLLGRGAAAWPAKQRSLPWLPEEETGPGRAPLLLLVGRRAPQVLAAEPGFRPWGANAGLHRHLLGAFGCVTLLETAHLDAPTGTTLLRLLSLTSSTADAHQRLDRVAADPTLSEAVKSQITDDLMTKQVTTTDEEHLTVRERTLLAGQRIGEKIGERRGEKRGERRGRQALLSVAHTVAPDALPRLQKIKDIDALEAAVIELVSAR